MNVLTTFIRHPYLALSMRLVLGGLLIWAGGVKASDLELTAQSVQNYQMVPLAWVNPIAMLLPAVELVVGLCLILGLAMNGAVLIATGMYAVFWVAVAAAMARGLDISCGCFGTANASAIGWLTLLRNTALLLALVPLWLGDRYWMTVDSCIARIMEPSSDPGAESAGDVPAQ